MLLTLPLVAQPRAPGPVRHASSASPVTDSLVRHYLARAMTMQGFNGLAPAERRAFAAWAAGVGTRFGGRVGGFWSTPGTAAQARALQDTLRRTAAELHHAQPTMVVQGTVFETIDACASNLPVPNVVRAEFGEDTVAVPQRNFQFAKMMYPGYFSPADANHYRWDGRPAGEAPGIPDMSQPETQRWFYCFARQQIDAGCEAIHFGQVMRMDDRDAGHHAWWSLLQRVRAYGRTRNRGFVLCDAHTHAEYYDPDPAQPLPPAQRQLLFDFHSFPTRPLELDTLRHDQRRAYLDYAAAGERSGAIYGQSGGGQAPDGTFCAHLPALVELDNGTLGRPGVPGQQALGVVWGLDEISWFATHPAAYRNQWLAYAAARVQQLDPVAYLEMPGLRGVTDPPRPGWLYRADEAGQGEAIRAIWASKTSPPKWRRLRARLAVP
ncbi:MAG: hypothetical protein ACRYG7_08025 [Janthinobacterium lividum]